GAARSQHRANHLVVGRRAREQAVDQSLGPHPEPRGELRLELVLAELAGLQADQQLAADAVLAESPSHRLGLEPLELAERPERIEQVGGEDAAVIDQETAEGP